MRTRYLVMLAVIALLVIGASVALAQGGESVDDQGNVNDPNVNERANACYEGGEWEGKCDTLLMWMGGWFRIRLDYGLMTEAELPSMFAWVASPVWGPGASGSSSTPSGGCIYMESGGVGGTDIYIDFGNGYFLSGPSQYSDSACATASGVSYPPSYSYVYAPAGYDALTLCNLNGTYTGASQYAGDVYRCN